MDEVLTSPQNPRLRSLRKLTTRRGRLMQNAFAVEGEDLVLAGLAAGWRPQWVAWTAAEPLPAALSDRLRGCEVVLVEPRLLAAASELGHPSRVIAVFELPQDVAFEQREAVPGVATLFLDGVRDPGNVGTIVRSAQAFGVRLLGLGPSTADPFSPKGTRASMGAIFEVETRHVGGIDEFAPPGSTVVAFDSGASDVLWEADFGASPVLCIGGEREGISAQVRERADVLVRIPQAGGESLNAAGAASIALYEWTRRNAAES